MAQIVELVVGDADLLPPVGGRERDHHRRLAVGPVARGPAGEATVRLERAHRVVVAAPGQRHCADIVVVGPAPIERAAQPPARAVATSFARGTGQRGVDTAVSGSSYRRRLPCHPLRPRRHPLRPRCRQRRLRRRPLRYFLRRHRRYRRWIPPLRRCLPAPRTTPARGAASTVRRGARFPTGHRNQRDSQTSVMALFMRGVSPVARQSGLGPDATSAGRRFGAPTSADRRR